MNRFLLLSFFIITSLISFGQDIDNDSLTRTAIIKNKTDANKVSFSADKPALRQIAGAPKAYYSHYWEFGDGHYSKKDNPTHTYKTKGNYSVRLSTTNNYDDGKPPTSRPKRISITDVSSTDFDDENVNLIDQDHGFRLVNDREPSPNEEMQLVVSYANDKPYPTNGKLYVFYNEKKYKNKNFNLIDTRTHYGETEVEMQEIIAANNLINYNDFKNISGFNSVTNIASQEVDTIIKSNLFATLEKAKTEYQDVKVWEFDNLKPEEKRNLFLSFKTTPEMLKDTTAVISIRSIYVPEDGGDAHQIRTKELEIVTSHDPNKMAVYDTRLSYRRVRNKRLKYKIRFQNNGEGPARLIKLNTDIPEMLTISSLKVLDMYPKVPICPKGVEAKYSCLDTVFFKDKISFQFKNIHLPGSNQKGVEEKDSTKGFVKYSLQFIKDFHKKPSRSKTAIIFDKNPPIITNTATSRFRTGLSIGVKAGYSYLAPAITKGKDLESSFDSFDDEVLSGDSYFLGLTISPYRTYRFYYQAEITGDIQKLHSKTTTSYIEELPETIRTTEQTTTISNYKQNLLLVPASVRYNFNSIFAVGAGVQLNVIVSNKEETVIKYHSKETYESADGIIIIEEENHSESNTKELPASLEDYTPFVDITAGLARIGPSVGFRYLYPIKQENPVFQIYAIWKF